MGLLIECPKCKRRNGEKTLERARIKAGAKIDACLKCGYLLGRDPGKAYWIEWRPIKGGEKKRERIGPNKAAAEHALRLKLSAKAEGRYIEKSPDATTRWGDLAKWYLDLPEVRAKRSYTRDKELIANLLPHFGDMLLKDITPATVEAYRQKRLSEPSRRTPTTLTKPATVNREVACLKTIFNKAVKNGKAEKNPAYGVKHLKENNERDRILSPEEYARLLAHSPAHLKPIIKLAYHTAMRQGEILFLTWGQVDLKEGFIKLEPEHTKTNEGRLVPLNREMVEMFKTMPRGLPGVRVFPYKGKAFGSSFQRAFETARKRAGIEGFTFHDLRHTAINNWRLQGHDLFRIMAVSGHKTVNMLKRYNKVSKEELKAMVG